MLKIGCYIVFLFICIVPAFAQDNAKAVSTAPDSAGTAAKTDREKNGKQVIKLDEGEVLGKLSRPQVVFLLQHNEHSYRTFNIRKDVNSQLNEYVPRSEMIRRYRIFYVEHLKDRMW